MRAAVTRIARPRVVERSTIGCTRSPARAVVSSSARGGDAPTRASTRSHPMTLAIGARSISAKERFARRTRPESSTTAMPSLSESNAVSHCSFACRTISKKRALAITMAACVATVESRRTSSGANPPPRGFAITRVPTTTPWARSGTAAAESACTSATSRVGSPPEQTGIVRPDGATRQLRQRTVGGGDPKQGAVLASCSGPPRRLAVQRQGDKGSLGVEKPHRVAHHLLDDAVELQRSRQDERQLLEGEQLRQAAVQLVRRPPAVALALTQAATQPVGPAEHANHG